MTDAMLVYKVCTRSAWLAAQAAGRYDGSADDQRDGFIHLSTASQLAGTLARHFRGCDDLVLVDFPSTALGAELRWEPSRGGDLFPHLYGPLLPARARSVIALESGADGVPLVPPAAAKTERS